MVTRVDTEELHQLLHNGAQLVEVLPAQEFKEVHLPGARSIPWGKAVNEDGTFKSYDELKALYGGEGIDGSKPVIAYCRIGERSSHSWFVLKYLLGMNNVTNYDGSWTEWGNLVGAPVEKGATQAAAGG